MAIEVFKGVTEPSLYTVFNQELFELAQFFSASANFNIIDSYSSAAGPPPPGRYIGDPISGGHWSLPTHVGVNNDWIIIECVTTLHPGLGLPNWQAKIQIQGNLTGFADPSDVTGVKYPKNHNLGRRMCVRFAPWGGWNLAMSNPDFVPVAIANPSSQNHSTMMGHAGSGEVLHWILLTGPGWYLRFSRKWNGTYRPTGVADFCGDVTPVDSADLPMPRAFLGLGTSSQNDFDGVIGNGRLLCEGDYLSTMTGTNLDYATTDTNFGHGIAFPKHDLSWVQETFSIAPADSLGVWTTPNPFGSGYEIDLWPYIPIPETTRGSWFAIPAIRRAGGVGVVPIAAKTWLSCIDGYGIMLPWDNASNFF